MRTCIFLLLVFIIGFSKLCAQDSTFVNTEIKKANKLMDTNLDSAINIINNCIKISNKYHYHAQLSKSYLSLIQYYDYRGKTDSALFYIDKCIDEAYKSKQIDRIIPALLKAAIINSESGKFKEAIDYALKAQKEADKSNNLKYRIKALHDIGYLYVDNRMEQIGIDYFKQGLELAIASRDTFNTANLCARIGGNYEILKQYDSSLKYSNLGLEYFTLLKHKRGIGISYNNIANAYIAQKDFNKGIDLYNKALDIRNELGDGYAIMMLNSNIGIAYYSSGDNVKAIEYLKRSLNQSLQENNYKLTLTNYRHLALAAYNTNNFKLYAEYNENYLKINDSINYAQNLKTIADLQTKYETDKKKEEIKFLQLNQEKKDLEHNQKIRQRNFIFLFAGVILILLSVFLVWMYKRYQLSQRQQKLIEEQKLIVDEKNHEIIDSINYAKTIQQAIMPTNEEFHNYFPDSFIFFKPKDIVSGDFYWFSKTDKYFYYCVADCTGHGVPGAFMSMMAMSFLNEIINEKKIEDTGEILDLLRIKVIHSLNKNNEDNNKKDGLDIVICRVNNEHNKLIFSGANNSLYVIRNGKLTEHKTNKQPVGLHSGKTEMFETNQINLEKGDSIYLFTDGYPDQFGGTKGKKFKYKQLEDLLLNNSGLPMSEQRNAIKHSFANWKGELEQVDDVCIIGIRL